MHGCEVSHTALFQLHTLLHPAILQRSWGARKDSTSLEYILKTGGNSWLFLCLLVAQIQISVQPQSQQAAVGSRVLLTCRASGPPDLKYQWFRGKEEVRLLPLLLLLFQWLILWLVTSSDLRGDRNYPRVDSVSFSASPPGSLYL